MAAIWTCALLSTGLTSLSLPLFGQSLTTLEACQDPSTLFLANRVAQERIKRHYVSIMDRQKHMDTRSGEYRRLDCLFYSLVKEEDRLRHEMTVLVKNLKPPHSRQAASAFPFGASESYSDSTGPARPRTTTGRTETPTHK